MSEEGEATHKTINTFALGRASVSACTAGDANGDGKTTIEEIVRALNAALNVCGGG